jgi:hypothetical protein
MSKRMKIFWIYGALGQSTGSKNAADDHLYVSSPSILIDLG